MKVNDLKNKNKTLKRIKSLQQYFNSSDFINQRKEIDSKKPEKYDLRTVLPHVGSYYDCVRDKYRNHVRIVIMGLEALDEHDYDIKERTDQIQVDTAVTPRCKRNPHMKGTTILLEFILKDLCGMEVKDEHINWEHIFKYFSLSNWFLLGCFLNGTNKAYRKLIKPEMAAEHFIETMKILEPTIVIIQGKSIYFGDAFVKYNKQPNYKYEWEYYGEVGKNYTVFRPTRNNELNFTVFRFLHPAQRGKNQWTHENHPYFKQTIAPVLKKYF